MDISEMMIGTTPSSDKESTSQSKDRSEPKKSDRGNDSPAPKLRAVESHPAESRATDMSAVERIRAYRSGELDLPTIAPAASSPPQESTADEEVDDPRNEPNTDDDDPDSDDDQPAPAGAVPPAGEFPQPRPRRVSRRAALVGGAAALVLLGGVVIPRIGSRNADNQRPAGGAQTTNQGPATSAAPAAPVNADATITPVSADGPEYPISLTPPMDAFTGEDGKGWICGGMDGTVLTITLPEPMVITEIGVIPGLLGTDKDGAELWAKHRIPVSVAYNLDYGEPIYGEYTATKRERQATEVPSIVTQTIRMVILGTEDVSGQSPDAPTQSQKPGLLGELGPLDFGEDTPASPKSSRPATFAIGSIDIIGHHPA